MKLTNLLLFALAILLAVAAYFALQGEKASTRTFKPNFAELDTAAVTAILVNSKVNNFEEIKFSRADGGWVISSATESPKPVMSGQVDGMLRQMAMLKADRVVSRNPDKWEEYKVGDAGTRARFMNGEVTLLDIVIGKISINMGKPSGTSQVPKQQPTSFVRLSESDVVYSTPQFLEPNFNKTYKSLVDTSAIQ